MRLEATATVPVAPEDLYAVAADLRNLPAWWIEHLSAEVVTPAARLRDIVYSVRYRLVGALGVTATLTVVAARPARSLTYMWEGGGMRLAVGQDFAAYRDGTRTRLVADLAVGPAFLPISPLMVRLMQRRLRDELDRALATLGELAVARTAMRRSATRTSKNGGEGAASPPS